MQDLINKLEKLSNSAPQAIETIARVEVDKHVQKAFINEGFTDKKLTKWTKTKKPKKRGKILTDTGHLADTLKVTSSRLVVKVASPTAYARVHNQSGRAGRNKTAFIPQRKFIGQSEVMMKNITTGWKNYFNSILKS